jgi:uncharacterized cupredoxin-like copper-binding protein
MNKYLIAVVAAALMASPALAAGTVVKVSLWDKGPSSLDKMGEGPGAGMGMPAASASHEMVGIKTDTATVPAGEVTFEVVNDSKDIVHEMIVAPAKPPKPLPFDKAALAVQEEATTHLGEVSELDPGAAGALKLTLKPGDYILYCNVPGHYMLGMWTELKVTG